MKTLVMKFGGASVATPEQFSHIADLIAKKKKQYSNLVVVVSAMAKTTNALIALAKRVNPKPPRREYDMLVTVGERVSISLLAMALAAKGFEAMSFTGSQAGIITCERHTNARIVDVRPFRILPHLELGKIIIIAGFQGMSREGEITTLGRGGSDTTAVALATCLSAERVEFYKDVKGIYCTDPKKNRGATFFSKLSYLEALKITSKGAKVLHPRSIQLAEKNQVPLVVSSFSQEISSELGTWVGGSSNVKRDLPVYEELEENALSTLGIVYK